jgi:hypothetical protein
MLRKWPQLGGFSLGIAGILRPARPRLFSSF